ncbi:MAG: FHIPEP family type III secretion protein, partial [Myxococcota bacterium]
PVLARKMGFGEGRDGETRLLSELIPQAREHVVMTIGVRMPPVKLRTVPSHPEGQVLFKVNEVAVATEELPVDHTLALAGPSELRRFGVTGRPTANPLNGRPAAWVSDAVAPLVESAGVSVWATDAALSLHLVRVTLEYAERFVGLQEVAEMVRSLEGCAPDLVAQVIPRTVTLSQTRDVLRQLVREGVSVRDLKTIVDALGTHGGTSANFIELVERVRAELGLQIVAAWAGPSRRVSAVTVDPVLEDLVRDAVVERPSGSSLALAPEHRRAIIEAAQRVLEPVMGAGAAPIIVTHAPVRYFFQELVAGELPARVLSYEELPRDIHVLPVGCVAFEAVERLVAA